MNHKEEFNKQIDMSHSYQHNVYVKTMTFKQSGLTYCGHHHTYDHVTLVASGKVRVKFEAVLEGDLPEEEMEYIGSSMFVTRSYRKHEITALEDNTVVCCIHAIRNVEGEIIVYDVPSHIDDAKEKLALMAYDMTPEEKLKSILRAEEEGTLQPGNADLLI